MVGPDGTVTAARALDGPPDLRERAEAAAFRDRYTPFMVDGAPVAVRFTDKNIILQEILPTVHVPFPEVAAPEDVTIGFTEGGCMGPCPVYSVEIGGDGTVVFEGDRDVAALGRHIYRVDPDEVASLVDAFRAADFFSLDDRYVGMMDGGAYTLSIAIGGRSKSVFNEGGTWRGMPDAVVELIYEIRRVADVEPMIEGTSDTIELLRAQGFDFTSPEAGTALVSAARRGSTEFFVALLEAGAPLSGMERDSGSAALADVAESKPEIAQALVAAAIERGTIAERTLTIGVAAHLGDAAAVQALVDGGADPDATEMFRLFFNQALLGETQELEPSDTRGFPPGIVSYALFGAAFGDSAEAARLLIEGEADPHVRDGNGNTPLHFAGGTGVAEVLIAAGADLETVNARGETPLLAARNEAVALTLIRAGADVTARAADGTSVPDLARSKGWIEVLALLE